MALLIIMKYQHLITDVLLLAPRKGNIPVL